MAKVTDRKTARQEIIRRANEVRLFYGARSKPYTGRTIERAVCVVRRARLVEDDVLTLAGFRPGRSRR